MSSGSRREFLRVAAGLASGIVASGGGVSGDGSWEGWLATARAEQETQNATPDPGERPVRDPRVELLNPRARVPISLIIDDSTCLVNLNRFAIPQFAAAFNNEKYHHDWRKMPAEIPDDFVRKFGDWCGERGVKGKYSIVPYPACVGRLDRQLPGWTQQELTDSLQLVRTLMLPNWDIHPEMVTHTRVIDTSTGHPYPELNLRFMENWDWTTGKSVDQLAEYLRYALEILRNVGLPCEGITTPGGFAARVVPELAQAVRIAVQDVFRAEIPHYFKFGIDSGPASVAPRVEYASGLDGPQPSCVVSIIPCTGDWTGGWDCSDRGHLDRFITADLREGRMVDVIERGEPAIMLAHWTGIYFNGEEVGFHVFQEAVRRLHLRFQNLEWMKLSEIARYWAAKELTRVEKNGNQVVLRAPFACPRFTLRIKAAEMGAPQLVVGGAERNLAEVRELTQLRSDTWLRQDDSLVLCFDLPKGPSTIRT